MNRTLLLILCDFLLLNLLALTRWETAEPPPPPQPQASEREPAPAVPNQEQDLVEAMRLSLEDEQAAREELGQRLQAAQQRLQGTEAALQGREQALSALEREKGTLESSLQEAQGLLGATRQSVEQMRQELAAQQQAATLSRERLLQLQHDLENKEAEARRQQEAMAQLERERQAAQSRIEDLDVAVRLSEEEKRLLRESLTDMRQEVETVRQEKVRIQEQAGVLAEGVSKLAEKSGELTQEIRENRPVNANVQFNDYLGNRVSAEMAASRPGLFGDIDRTLQSRTVLVSDGQATYALFHADETPFRLTEQPDGWSRVSGRFLTPIGGVPFSEMRFLALDPRVIAVPTDQATVDALGVKVYSVALEPFKFAEAVLISRGGQYYGETEFRLDARTPSYVRMNNRLFNRLFGEFSPSTGDLVFSKTGELLGIMVNRDYCALIDNFLPAQQMPLGSELDRDRTRNVLQAMRSRLVNLPVRLQ